MIDKIIEENKTAGNLFTADQQNLTKCEGCGFEAGFEETFTMLTLDIDQDLTNTESQSTNIKHRSNSLESLLCTYSEWEKLIQGNEYYCSKCRTKQPAQRKTEIVYGPKILAMQLKRFKVTNKNNFTTISKLKRKVIFQKTLALPTTLSSIGMTSKYQLKGVIEHRGETAENGHYVAYVRKGNQWMELDDDKAKPISWNVVAKLEAYILFWELV